MKRYNNLFYKTLIVFIMLFNIAVSSAVGQEKKTVKAQIKVFGNCDSCKERIENSLDVPGIKTASWDSKSKLLNVVYNKAKISEEKIHELVAAVGHDTEKVKAKDEVYTELPFCCLYRDHDHSNIKDEKPSGNHKNPKKP